MNDRQKLRHMKAWSALNDVWYLKIDIDVPEAMANEAKAVYDLGYYVEHRLTEGWSSAPVHTWGHSLPIPWENTQGPVETNVKWGWTEVAEHAPETVRWLKDFPHKQLNRCRFMCLEPGATIPGHHDSTHKNIFEAINLGLTQPDGCEFRRLDKEDILPFEPLSAFWFDNSVYHTVVNNSMERRLHFIIHGHDLFLDLAEKSFKKQFGNNILNEIYSTSLEVDLDRKPALDAYIDKIEAERKRIKDRKNRVINYLKSRERRKKRETNSAWQWKDWYHFKSDIESNHAMSRPIKGNTDAKVALVLMNPKKTRIRWNERLESETNMTFYHLWAISESGYNKNFRIYLIDENNLQDELKKMNEDYAFICESGMVLNVDYWREHLINEDVDFLKCHIMAHKEHEAWNHHMNMWLNLKEWKRANYFDLSKPYWYGNRSIENHHSDYTPYWLQIPVNTETTIHNFTTEERDNKAWSYHKVPDKNYEKIVWSNIAMNDETVKRIKTGGRFFYFNNEATPDYWKNIKDIDIALFPTSGLNAEEFAYMSQFKGKIIYYDVSENHLELKKLIHEMNPGKEGYKIIQNWYNRHGVSGPFELENFPLNTNKAIDWVNNNCEKEYRIMDLVTTDYDDLAAELKGKKVLFHYSNIWTYDLVHIQHTLKYLDYRYKELRSKLYDSTKKVHFSGESPWGFTSSDENLRS